MVNLSQSSSSNRRELAVPDDGGLTFNFALALPGRASSRHTQRAYFRWVDTYLVDIAGLPKTTGAARLARMYALPIKTLCNVLSATQLRAWLGILSQQQGKQGIDQARAAIITLADLLAEAEWIDEYTAAAMSRVRSPHSEEGQRPGRWLSPEQIHALMAAAEAIAVTENQRLRNIVVIRMLCTMALRRDELSTARWDDLSAQNNRAILRVHGKGRKVANVDIPQTVLRALDEWRKAVTVDVPILGSTPLIRRIWKGGDIAQTGLSPDGIWHIINQAASYAQLGHVAPHDLRRSVAGALHQSGVPIEKISRLLRHSNVIITERYLNRLPQPNEGAILMSEMLGLEDKDKP